jgi:hypothetical protein
VKRFFQWLGAKVLWIAGWVLCRTLRVTVVNAPPAAGAGKSGTRYVIAFWHGSMFFAWYVHRSQRIAALVSRSKDGEILASTLKHWGYEVIRGSSSRGGGEAMDLMTEAVLGGHSLAVTPDGPRGPRLEMKMGAVRVAQKTATPLLLCAARFRHPIVLRSWDGFEIPRPFSRGVLLYSDPITVDTSLNGESLDSERRRIEAMLVDLDAKAREMAATP